MKNENGESLHVSMTSEPYMTKGARRASRRLGWSLVVLFVVTAAIGVGNLLFTKEQNHSIQRAELSSCSFFLHLAGLPVTTIGTTGKASLLAVQIVSDSRVSWRGRGCPGTLPLPSQSFRKWAAYYHVPVG